jgi:F0F1-type ATP synthase assembly protein I
LYAKLSGEHICAAPLINVQERIIVQSDQGNISGGSMATNSGAGMILGAGIGIMFDGMLGSMGFGLIFGAMLGLVFGAAVSLKDEDTPRQE